MNQDVCLATVFGREVHGLTVLIGKSKRQHRLADLRAGGEFLALRGVSAFGFGCHGIRPQPVRGSGWDAQPQGYAMRATVQGNGSVRVGENLNRPSMIVRDRALAQPDYG